MAGQSGKEAASRHPLYRVWRIARKKIRQWSGITAREERRRAEERARKQAEAREKKRAEDQRRREEAIARRAAEQERRAALRAERARLLQERRDAILAKRAERAEEIRVAKLRILRGTRRKHPSAAARQLRHTVTAPEAGKRVLLIGDSLLERWPAQILPKPFHNIAVGGNGIEHTIWMFRRLAPEIRRHTFTTAIVMIGTNNLARGHFHGPIVWGIRRLLGQVKAIWPDIQIVLMTIPDRTDPRATDGLRHWVNGFLREEAQKDHVTVFETDAVLTAPGEVSKCYDPDQIHLTPEAYRRLRAPLIAQVLELERQTDRERSSAAS